MDVSCSLVDILVGEKLIGQWGYTRQPIVLPRELIGTGQDLMLKVIGSPHNLFGAFHDPNPKMGIVGNPSVGPTHGPIPGDRYALQDYGLMGCPSLRPLKAVARQHFAPSQNFNQSTTNLQELAAQ